MFEFYVQPEHRARAFDLFEALLSASGARFMEIQSSDALLTVMLHTYARDICSEKIVFQDGITIALPSDGAALHRVTTDDHIWRAVAERQGAAECLLQRDGVTVATGGLMFLYNVPYTDIYMEVLEPSGAAASGRISSRSSSGWPTDSEAFHAPAAIQTTSRRARRCRRRAWFHSPTFSMVRCTRTDSRRLSPGRMPR